LEKSSRKLKTKHKNKMETRKKNRRSVLNNLLWYSSGLDIRDLAEQSKSKSAYFGLGGVNLFSTFTIIILGILASAFAFLKMPLILDCIVGVIFGAMTYFFNRQTISMLIDSERQFGGKNWNSITTLPAFILAIFISLLISTPLKFYLFEVPIQESIFKSLKALSELTDSSVSLKISSWSITILITLVILFPILIKLYSKGQKIEKNRSTIINEVMWFCAGTNNEILRKCPTDHSKYFGIGGTILFTALMATMSGGYAFYTAFHNPTSAIFFGLFWGAMIFNLDRYIVNTIYTDGTVKITKGEILAGLPRIIIAIFLGIVISLPLELKLFEDEIKVEIGNIKKTLISENQSDTIYVELDQLKIRKTVLENIRAQINQGTFAVMQDQDIQILEKDISDIEGTNRNLSTRTISLKLAKNKSDSTRIDKHNNGIRSNIKNNEALISNKHDEIAVLRKASSGSKQQQLDQINTELATNTVKINQLEEQKKVFDDEHANNIKALNGLAAHMDAFSNIKKKKFSMQISSFFIMMLLIIIEIAPVLFKLMTESGPYDDMLKTIKHEVSVREKQKISDINDEINTNIRISSEKNRNKLEAEVKANEELLSAIALAQAEIAKVAIEKWKQKEIQKATENPESFIQAS
jgi:hypothetical protein